MAKTRKRSETAAPEAASQQSPPAPQEPRRDASTNGSVDRIAARAYELYLERGGSHGQDWDDWLRAEREIIGNTSRDEER